MCQNCVLTLFPITSSPDLYVSFLMFYLDLILLFPLFSVPDFDLVYVPWLCYGLSLDLDTFMFSCHMTSLNMFLI